MPLYREDIIFGSLPDGGADHCCDTVGFAEDSLDTVVVALSVVGIIGHCLRKEKSSSSSPPCPCVVSSLLLRLLPSTLLGGLFCASRGSLDRVELGMVEKLETWNMQTSVAVATTLQWEGKIILELIL